MRPKRRSILLDLAGIRTDHPIGDSVVTILPPVDCRDGILRYNIAGAVLSDGEMQYRPVDRSMLREFLELAEASDDAVYRYSVKWGALQLCEHGLPYWHRGRFISCGPTPVGLICSERVEHWRTLAATFNSLINISAELNQGRSGSADDWRYVDRRLTEAPLVALLEHDVELQRVLSNVSYARDQLPFYMGRLIWLSRISIGLNWSKTSRSWVISLRSFAVSLFAQLSLALLLTVAEKEGYAVCSSCHQNYMPKRQPDPTRRHYCPKCGIKAAWRDAARDASARRRNIAEQA